MTTEWQAGLQAFRDGRMREAVDRLQNAVNETELSITLSARFQTYAFLGAAQYALGSPAKAVESFEAALRFLPVKTPPSDLLVNLANAYLAVGKRESAQQMLQSALKTSPGHIEARMLLQRLVSQQGASGETGMVLGESPSSVKQFLRSLVFKTAATGGYDPAQVRQAFLQIEHYVDFLIAQIAHNQTELSKAQQEILRLQQSEDAMVQNIILAQKDADLLRKELEELNPGKDNVAEKSRTELSPLEKLFQRKV